MQTALATYKRDAPTHLAVATPAYPQSREARPPSVGCFIMET